MSRDGLLEEALTHSVIGAFYEVYNTLGHGFLEHIYGAALARELIGRGHRVEREVLVHVYYKGDVIGVQRLDMVVDGKVIIENKSTHHLSHRDPRQLYNYLKATMYEVGLLLHYGHDPAFYRMVCGNQKKNLGGPARPEQ